MACPPATPPTPSAPSDTFLGVRPSTCTCPCLKPHAYHYSSYCPSFASLPDPCRWILLKACPPGTYREALMASSVGFWPDTCAYAEVCHVDAQVFRGG